MHQTESSDGLNDLNGWNVLNLRAGRGGKRNREVKLRVAVDIGGAFTNVVVFDEAKSTLALAKALSTPAELARGVEEGLTKAAVPLDQVLSLIHGSTIVVNAIIERRGAKTALITTKGFRDVYEIGRINRPESFNPRFRKHRPLVPRENIFEVTERMLADGSVRTLFDEQEAREVARIIKGRRLRGGGRAVPAFLPRTRA